MESKRQLKFSKQIQKDLSDIFIKDLQGAFGKAFITITEVKVSPDLGLAKIYLSIFGAASREETLHSIREKTKQIRSILSAKIRHQAAARKTYRTSPKLLHKNVMLNSRTAHTRQAHGGKCPPSHPPSGCLCHGFCWPSHKRLASQGVQPMPAQP